MKKLMWIFIRNFLTEKVKEKVAKFTALNTIFIKLSLAPEKT